MGFLASIVSWVTSGALSGLLTPILAYFTAKNDVNLEGMKAAVGADTTLGVAYLNSQVETAQIKAAQNMWFGARIIVLLTAGSASLHFAGIMLDSIPMFGHVVGSWSIPKLPAPYDSQEWLLIESFFIMTPVAPVLSAVSSWLHRR